MIIEGLPIITTLYEMTLMLIPDYWFLSKLDDMQCATMEAASSPDTDLVLREDNAHAAEHENSAYLLRLGVRKLCG